MQHNWKYRNHGRWAAHWLFYNHGRIQNDGNLNDGFWLIQLLDFFQNKIWSKNCFLTLFECHFEKSYEKSLGIEFLGWFGCTRAGLEPWLEPIWLEILMMDFGWSRNWIALEISLKILEFYVENYLFWGRWANMYLMKYIFLCILAQCVLLEVRFCEMCCPFRPILPRAVCKSF